MIKALRKLADWLEVKDCLISQKWNKFLDKSKVKINYCKNCVCEELTKS
jgi:hypothetical protein